MQSQQLVALFGYVVMIFLAWLMSAHRGKFPWRVVIGGTLLQFGFALVTLKTDAGLWFFAKLGDGFSALMAFVDKGSDFVFGPLLTAGDPPGADPAVQKFNPVFAFKVLPTIIFFSALMSILYHIGVMQLLVRFMSRIMQVTLRTSGAESLSASANIFVGQTEAPLVVKPYLSAMTNSELMAIMVGGFATIAGGVMAAYISFGVAPAHLITASLISAPAGLLIAKVLQPEIDQPLTLNEKARDLPVESSNLIEAATLGASDGLKLLLNVGAMLIAFIALIAMCDFIIEHSWNWLMQVCRIAEPPKVTLTGLLSWGFAPFAWLMGIPSGECVMAGELLGKKMVVNEFVAYIRLGELMNSKDPARQISERSAAIMTYALCGFSNFSSIGIQVGGIGALAPERRADLSRLGLRAMLGGTLACFMTACIAAILI